MHSGAIIIRGNFSPGESICQFSLPILSLVKISANFLSCVIADIATSTTLVKIIIYFIEYFCYTKVAGLDKIFAQRNFLSIRYHHWDYIIYFYPTYDVD